MPESRIERAGQSLYKEFIAREEFSLMVGPEAPADIEEAYSVQDVYMDLKARDAGGYAGYKIAYTTKVMQERLGAKEPVYGRILSDGVFNSPCKVKASDYVNIGVDPTTYSWGNMINAARLEMSREPIVWWSLFSAFLFMFILVLFANLFSDVVREAFDPRASKNYE